MNDIVRKHGSERGFTLMECIISLVILGFVAAVITGTMGSGAYRPLMYRSRKNVSCRNTSS